MLAALIQPRIGLPPLLRRKPEPEVENLADPRFGHQAAVPPTVSPSIISVGWPTPAGTDWPPLPQTPMPSSSAMSLPIAATLVSTVGPSPIRVAPLIGAPSLPFSIR